MFEEELSSEARRLIDNFFANPARKQFLLTELVDLKKLFSGEVADKLRDFYINSGLVNHSIKKIKTRDRKTILVGIEELMEMNITSAIPALDSLLTSPEIDEDIKGHVHLAILNLDPDQGFRYINEANSYLTEWQQLTIIALLDRKNYFDVPYLDKWLDKNDSLIIFGCRLIRFTKSLIEIPLLTEMVSTSKPTIKVEVIKTLGVLEVNDVTPLLIEIYPYENEEVKEAILLALGQFTEPAALSFLVECAILDPFKYKMLAVRAIDKTEGGDDALKQLLSLRNPEIDKIIRHVSDPRL
ncbi:HEAT repeat domain-containing protein [Telluribacter sp.]|jgi:hypothetical protein|uniref:HEAT repeat domain-containing protein n=1 Tax=Telluribacter sp. TaxID=1978767 RepID=UPI002E15115B|nr:HEAT repeat domain-containing protein [Telluribacter sp.]